MPWLSRFNVKVLILWVRTGNLWVRFGLMKCLKKTGFCNAEYIQACFTSKTVASRTPQRSSAIHTAAKMQWKNLYVPVLKMGIVGVLGHQLELRPQVWDAKTNLSRNVSKGWWSKETGTSTGYRKRKKKKKTSSTTLNGTIWLWLVFRRQLWWLRYTGAAGCMMIGNDFYVAITYK